jgi:RsiW-degrading membrane proteinase PrsW (M82 family)
VAKVANAPDAVDEKELSFGKLCWVGATELVVGATAGVGFAGIADAAFAADAAAGASGEFGD